MMTREDIAALDDIELVRLLTIESEQHSADVLSWATDEQVIESKLRGDAICAALAQYREDVGRFPGSLLTLTPEYLAEVPDTAVGAILSHGFSYALVDGGYSLRFQQRGGAWWSRDTGGSWSLSDPP